MKRGDGIADWADISALFAVEYVVDGFGLLLLMAATRLIPAIDLALMVIANQRSNGFDCKIVRLVVVPRARIPAIYSMYFNEFRVKSDGSQPVSSGRTGRRQPCKWSE